MNVYYKSKASKSQHLYSQNLHLISKKPTSRQKLYFMYEETRLEREFERDSSENLNETRARTWSRIWIHIITSNSTAMLKIYLFDWFWLDMTIHFSVNFSSFRFTFFKQHDLRCLKNCQKNKYFSKEKRDCSFYPQLWKLFIFSFHRIIW